MKLKIEREIEIPDGKYCDGCRFLQWNSLPKGVDDLACCVPGFFYCAIFGKTISTSKDELNTVAMLFPGRGPLRQKCEECLKGGKDVSNNA